MNMNRAFRNRSQLFRWFLLVIMGLFVIRLFYLQIIQHDIYVGLADQEQLKRLVIPAKRGEIYALSNGSPVPLVKNQTVYTVFVDPSEVTKPDDVEALIKNVAGGNTVGDMGKKIRESKIGDKTIRYQKLATGLSYKQAKLIKDKGLHGVGLQSTIARVYPEGSLASQTLGFVDANGNGAYGIEQGMDSKLKGKDGLLQSVTDVSNVPLTIGKDNVNIPPKDGQNVVLSIDRNVQAYTQAAVARGAKQSGAESVSAIVMDAQTGRVMAMANTPTYNPSNYGDVKDLNVFNNDVVSSPYEPGSVMKTFTIATAMDKGVIEPTSRFYNTDSVRVNDFTIHNAELGHTGNITYQDVLNYSLNTGSVEALKQIGGSETINAKARSTLYDYFYNRFRLGRSSGIEVAGENPGGLISPEEQEGNAIRYANMTFGQGLDVTMLQVTAGFCSLVNGGTYRAPSVVAGTMQNGQFEPSSIPAGQRVVGKPAAEKMREMVHQVRQLSMFTGGDKGYYVGGKTGTSQAIVNGRYVFSQTIGTYIGFGGSKEQTKYVIMVRVSGKNRQFTGGTDAKPVFTDISNWLLRYLKVQPKG